MKNISKISLSILVVVFITPQTAFASWWNPFTWSIFTWHRAPVVDVVPVQKATTPTVTPDVVTSEDTTPEPATVATSSNKKTDSVIKKIVPVAGTTKATVSASTTPVTPTVVATSTAMAASATSTATYAVRTGDSLVSIAKMFDVSLDVILASNNLASTSKLFAWQSLTIPGVKDGTPALLLTQKPVNYAAISVINTFLASPTLENLKTFCTTATKIPGRNTKEVFNDDRTDFVPVSLSAYADLTSSTGFLRDRGVCNTATSTSWHWTGYDASYVLSFLPTDSDAVRTYRINYNKAWNDLSKYHLIGWSLGIQSQLDQLTNYVKITVTTPKEAAMAMILCAENPPPKSTTRWSSTFTCPLSPVEFYLPEKELCNAKRNYGYKATGESSDLCK